MQGMGMEESPRQGQATPSELEEQKGAPFGNLEEACSVQQVRVKLRGGGVERDRLDAVWIHLGLR